MDCPKKNKLDISPEELKQLIAQKDLCLVDVRKRMEREHFHIGGLHIPLHELTQRIHELKNKETLIFYCKVGQRSSIAADLAKETFPPKYSCTCSVVVRKLTTRRITLAT